MNSLDNVLDAYDNNPFNFFSSSGIRLNILGRKGMKIKEKIDKKIKDEPYLVAYFTNENIGKGKNAVNRVYSCNLTSIRCK